MVRGKKKNTSSKNGTGCATTSNNTTPLPSKSKRKFRGKLSHSATSPNKITKYYSVSISPKSQENSPVLSIKVNTVCNEKNSASVFKEKKEILRETNKIPENKIHESSSTSNNKIDKTESCVPISPSTALSQLHLNENKKISKVKKRLPLDNDSELNVLKPTELPEKSILKNESKNNSKVTDNQCDFTKSQTKLTEFYQVRRSVRKTGKAVLEEKQKTLEEAILSNKEDGLEVRIFEGKGRGVVSSKKFAKGEFVVEYAGELITVEEAKKREAIYSQDENTGCYMYYFKYKNNQYCVDATPESNRFGRLLNHSRNGNLCTKTVEIKGTPHLILLAKEDIECGSELTYDYGDRSKLSLQYHPWLAQ